jgi:hypothetical protein
MAPRTAVTNAQVLQAIDALSRQVQARDEPLEARLDEVTVTLTDVVRRQAALEQVVTAALTKEAKRDTCPFRDDIVSGANHKRRIEAVENKAHALEVRVAAGGLFAVLITAVITGGKAVGWW